MWDRHAMTSRQKSNLVALTGPEPAVFFPQGNGWTCRPSEVDNGS